MNMRKMEDLHFALESNNMTKGWQPQHPIFMYHSFKDTVVPEVNRERAGNTIGEWVKGSGMTSVAARLAESPCRRESISATDIV